MSRPGQPLPSIPDGFTLPFYYASLVNLGVYYEVDPAVVAPYLQGTGLVAAVFEGKACVTFNYQLYTGHYDFGAGVTSEIELNIVAYPENRADLVAQVDFRGYISGQDQSKQLGNHRVWVPCDNDAAIAAGMQLFGEPKFKTSFTVGLPVLNSPSVRTWSVRCNDPEDPEDAKVFIFEVGVDTKDLDPHPVVMSPITEYGKHDGKLIGCRWNLLGPVTNYYLTRASAGRVTLGYGDSTHPMVRDMKTLIGDTPASAIRTYLSAPSAIQARAYFP
ncbi:hypothetical protein [Paraliomyxa miuraensis]|uniref:hypothetical protein n=1 Tax=Paraliomyxa miuraensis TaxID=376150 RepID=UPI00224EE1E9|nr:hypothetical protein [Paraliomyxa miuraensis]MCX4240389.1 hypothetical protein [Paraliomyxa miuraensis]